ncbi:helix-turn-helix domain-containing protein [Streptomyces alboflavus]|uniref:helix-turn-helix domain-containing protein n=1 Tax=Streptomyces alboflavus TaxID=67267 RepID=UPI003690B1D7
MAHWSEFSTGQRIKILRCKVKLSQAALAEKSGLTVRVLRSAEQDDRLSLPTLLALAAALPQPVSVILGEQEPHQSFSRRDMVMLRNLGPAVHDTAAGSLDSTVEPLSQEELRRIVDHAWTLYWRGQYGEVGVIATRLIRAAAVGLHDLPDGSRAPGWGTLSDSYRLAAYVANLWGLRDLAYAAIGHAGLAAERAADPLRGALVDSGRSWVMLRDARLPEALALAEKAAVDIEPGVGTATTEDMVVYGSHVNFAAVVASRMGNKERAADFLSQSHATGQRMGQESTAHGTLFGPVTATTQAVGINVSLGHTAKALSLMNSVHDVSSLQEAAQHRFQMDKALTLVEAGMYDDALDTIEAAVTAAPHWASHQSLPAVIVEKVSHTHSTLKRLRRVSSIIGTPAIQGGFAQASLKTAL